jgi:hypothetical protein
VVRSGGAGEQCSAFLRSAALNRVTGGSCGQAQREDGTDQQRRFFAARSEIVPFYHRTTLVNVTTRT